jgi:acetyl esterase/lipase
VIVQPAQPGRTSTAATVHHHIVSGAGNPWLDHRYGPHPVQVAHLALPPCEARAQAPAPVVIMIHGGFWRARYDAGLQHDVAAVLTSRGVAVWNVDYRAVGAGPSAGGGWPVTYTDVALAVGALVPVAAQHELDARRMAVVGHSAGGALALWVAGRHRLSAGSPGAGPLLRPAAVVGQAAVCDLVAGARRSLGAGAVRDLMGAGPDDAPADYAVASPAALLPLGVPVLLVSGADDDVVPSEQSRAFAATALTLGDDVTLEVIPGEAHVEHLDPRSTCWAVTRSWLEARWRVPAGG